MTFRDRSGNLHRATMVDPSLWIIEQAVPHLGNRRKVGGWDILYFYDMR